MELNISHYEKNTTDAMNLSTYQVLVALGARDRNAVDILAAIREQSGAGRAPSLASFYRHLGGAVDHGWVQVVPGEEATGNPGRPGQVYRLTPAGRAGARAEALRLRELAALADAEPRRAR